MNTLQTCMKTRAHTRTHSVALLLLLIIEYTLLNILMKLLLKLNQYSPSGTRHFRPRPSRCGPAPGPPAASSPAPVDHGGPGSCGGAHLCWGRQGARSHEDRVEQVGGVGGGFKSRSPRSLMPGGGEHHCGDTRTRTKPRLKFFTEWCKITLS